MRTSTQANPFQLTAREFEVLLLLCEGLRSSVIAKRLFRSVRTVDHHLTAVFAKLGVASRTEAVALALRAGLHACARPAVARNLGRPAVVVPARKADTADAAAFRG